MVHTRLLADRTSGQRDTAPGHSGTGTPTRHLAAILAADVAGYSRLMGVDEEGTLERLKAHRGSLSMPRSRNITAASSRPPATGCWSEFASVVDAVRCAVEIQRAMADRNTDTPEDQRITFRIGINLGDVIADGDDIYGDGVNIAARLEALAEPGGICISRVVWDQIRDKLPYAFEDMGEQSVKNIARPVSAYALGADAVASTSLVAARPQAQPGATRRDTSRPLVIRRKRLGRDRHRGRRLVGLAPVEFAEKYRSMRRGGGANKASRSRRRRDKVPTGIHRPPLDRRPALREPVEAIRTRNISPTGSPMI